MVPGEPANAWSTTTFFQGLSQETCRDLGHVQYGFAAMINAAETGRIQGVDLYSEQAARIVAGLELNASYLNGKTTPMPVCPPKGVTGFPNPLKRPEGHVGDRRSTTSS